MTTDPSRPLPAAQQRLLAADVLGGPLDEPVPAGVDVLAGAPTAAVTSLADVAGAEVGVWEMTPGTVTDVEAGEVFVVLSGRAVLTVADGEPLDLTPGSVVRLHAGEPTTWTVTETLRKVYVTPSA
ncbi:cupin domain-containing protein [Terrabacter carboxydivorans]|uniref:Cupin domain-containing protein n=1 Tax=Terrabacter carboxydivorans TaxID=619730 RepID=A0ABP5Y049_9MICO